MADEAGVMDAVEVETGAEEVESGAEQVEEGAEQVESAEAGHEAEKPESPYTTKFSREMRAALKAWEQSNPEAAKFAKQARDNHARMFALSQIEPKGIDGIRERYALLDGLTRGDFKGADALTAIQEELAGVEEVDNLLAAGDPKAFDALGDDFNAGLAKLAPAYLDRIAKSDPAAFEAAVLPHFVSALSQSELVKDFNALVDVLNAKDDPRFDDATKMKFTIQSLARMGEWLNSLQTKAGQMKAAPVTDNKQSEFEQERTRFEQEKQDLHWNTKIAPLASTHENKTFDTLFEPYQRRLKLDAGAKADLLQAFKGGMEKAGKADADYMRQMKIYRGQKNPDPAAVANVVRNAINKHSKVVMEGLIKARYSPFLQARPKTGAVTPGAGKAQIPPGPNVQVVSVKPDFREIDHRNTPLAWSTPKKDGSRQYRLMSGKVVLWRPQ